MALGMMAQMGWAESMTPGFYDGVTGMKDAELKGNLKALIRDHTAIAYGTDTWEVFYYSDQDENGYCMDMYCDEWQKFGSPGTAVSGCNIEHSFAKSWWGGGKNDAYKDCYHLNPSNSTANSARSNYPLGVPVKEIKTSGSLRIGKIHHDALDVDFWVFEPKDEYKGDFARAYFYMATCYGRDKDGNIDPVCSQYNGWRTNNSDVGSKFAMQNDNYLEFQPWEQEVLIAWHRADPVSEKEIKRQDAVSDFQHNRNPYIDYPYLAEYIWGKHAGEAVDMSLLMASSDAEFVPGVSNGWRGADTPPTPPTPVTKYGINWMANGELIRTDSIEENKQPTELPDAPSSCSTESNVFMGWTNITISGTSDDAPEVLYKAAEEIPALTDDITLHAVYANARVEEMANMEKTETIVFSYVFNSDQNVTSVNGEFVQITFAQGTAGTAPKYYSSGTAVRVYGGGSMTVSAENMTRIDLTFGSGDKSNAITTNVGTFVSPTWTGQADEVVFTVGGSSGHRRFASVAVTMNSSGSSTTYSRYITSCETATETERVRQDTVQSRKILKDGRLLIIRGEAVYDVTGRRVR